jgi:general secretion pathway protein J
MEDLVYCVKSAFTIDCHSGLDLASPVLDTGESSNSELDSRFRGNDGFGTNVKKRRTHDTRKGSLTAGINLSVSAGFTLLEVIVTLTILGLILLIISSAFRLGLSAWEKGESVKEEYQKVREISRLVCQQIKSSIPYKMKTETAEGDYLAFDGKTHSLKFVSALPIKARQPQGFVYALYEFQEEGRDEGRLVYYEQRVLNKNFFEEKPKEESSVSLLEGISDVRFEYFRREDKDKSWTEGWVEQWNAKDENELPQALRVTITLKNKNTEKREAPFSLLASISANRFEEVRIGATKYFSPQLPAQPAGAGNRLIR